MFDYWVPWQVKSIGSKMKVYQVFKAFFWCLQLSFAIYFTCQAIFSWNASPVVTSVSRTSIDNVPFPAVTVCSKTRGKWAAMSDAILHLDPRGWKLSSALDNSDVLNLITFWEAAEKRLMSLTSLFFPDWIESQDLFFPDELEDMSESSFISSNLDSVFAYRLSFAISIQANNSKDFILGILKRAMVLKAASNGSVIQSLDRELCDQFMDLNCGEYNETAADIWLKDHDELLFPGTGIGGFGLSRMLDKDFLPEEICWQTSIDNRPSKSNLSQWCNEGYRYPDIQKVHPVIVAMFYIDKFLTHNDMIDIVLDYTWGSDNGEAFRPFLANILQLPNKTELIDDTINLPILWDILNGQKDRDNWIRYLSAGVAEQITYSLKDFDISQGTLTNVLESNRNLTLNLFEWMRQPKPHFNSGSLYPLIPLCVFKIADINFDEDLSICRNFAKEQIIAGESCFTFNFDGNIGSGAGTIHPKTGLTFLVETRNQAWAPTRYIRLLIHEPGTMSDLEELLEANILIHRGHNLEVNVRPTVLKSTDSFRSMSLEKRQCIADNHYDQVSCLYQERIKLGIRLCQCSPWYLLKRDPPYGNICGLEKMNCFNDIMKNKTYKTDILKSTCLESCYFIEYSPYLNELPLLIPTNDDDNVIYQYVTRGLSDKTENSSCKNNMCGAYPNALVELDDSLSLIQEKRLSKRTALVNVKFSAPQALIITKDAKVTFPDMLGNIGGTFGMFLGLSFVGLLDMVTYLYQVLAKKCSNNA